MTKINFKNTADKIEALTKVLDNLDSQNNSYINELNKLKDVEKSLRGTDSYDSVMVSINSAIKSIEGKREASKVQRIQLTNFMDEVEKFVEFVDMTYMPTFTKPVGAKTKTPSRTELVEPNDNNESNTSKVSKSTFEHEVSDDYKISVPTDSEIDKDPEKNDEFWANLDDKLDNPGY